MTYIQQFMQKYPHLVALMKQTEHNSKYHEEGSVWTHTCMVYTLATSKYPNNTVLELTALLHDIGKCYVGFIEDGKTRFTGHEGYSTFLAISILDDFKVPQDIKLEVLKTISLHGVNLSEIRASVHLRQFRELDIMGRISAQQRDDYEPRKFITPPTETTHTVNILVGLPASGKSTFAQFSGLPIIARDIIIKDMYPDFTYTQAFNTVQSDPALLQLVSQKLDKLTSQLSREQKDCVIDMTNTSLSSRRKHMNKFNKAEFKATVFLPPMSTIESRNLSRPGKLIPKTVYESMMKSFVMPIRDEGFTSIDYIL